MIYNHHTVDYSHGFILKVLKFGSNWVIVRPFLLQLYSPEFELLKTINNSEQIQEANMIFNNKLLITFTKRGYTLFDSSLTCDSTRTYYSELSIPDYGYTIHYGVPILIRYRHKDDDNILTTTYINGLGPCQSEPVFYRKNFPNDLNIIFINEKHCIEIDNCSTVIVNENRSPKVNSQKFIPLEDPAPFDMIELNPEIYIIVGDYISLANIKSCTIHRLSNIRGSRFFGLLKIDDTSFIFSNETGQFYLARLQGDKYTISKFKKPIRPIEHLVRNDETTALGYCERSGPFLLNININDLEITIDKIVGSNASFNQGINTIIDIHTIQNQRTVMLSDGYYTEISTEYPFSWKNLFKRKLPMGLFPIGVDNQSRTYFKSELEGKFFLFNSNDQSVTEVFQKFPYDILEVYHDYIITTDNTVYRLGSNYENPIYNFQSSPLIQSGKHFSVFYADDILHVIKDFKEIGSYNISKVEKLVICKETNNKFSILLNNPCDKNVIELSYHDNEFTTVRKYMFKKSVSDFQCWNGGLLVTTVTGDILLYSSKKEAPIGMHILKRPVTKIVPIKGESNKFIMLGSNRGFILRIKKRGTYEVEGYGLILNTIWDLPSNCLVTCQQKRNNNTYNITLIGIDHIMIYEISFKVLHQSIVLPFSCTKQIITPVNGKHYIFTSGNQTIYLINEDSMQIESQFHSPNMIDFSTIKEEKQIPRGIYSFKIVILDEKNVIKAYEIQKSGNWVCLDTKDIPGNVTGLIGAGNTKLSLWYMKTMFTISVKNSMIQLSSSDFDISYILNYKWRPRRTAIFDMATKSISKRLNTFENIDAFFESNDYEFMNLVEDVRLKLKDISLLRKWSNADYRSLDKQSALIWECNNRYVQDAFSLPPIDGDQAKRLLITTFNGTRVFC